MERKPYLIGHSFRFHMAASIMTMTAMNLNSIIDGILMGNLLGADAFSAINVVMPIVSCISAIGVLLAQGPSMRMAQHLGAMKNDEANQVYTISMVSMLIVGLAVSGAVMAAKLAAPAVQLLCVAQELTEPALKYASVLMAGSVLLIFENGLSMLVDVMGNPRIVTIGTILKTGTNILFDIVNIKILGMDIAGAAYATLIGSLVGDAFFIIYIVRSSGMKFCACPQWLKDLGTGIAQSLPGFIGSLSAVAMMFICNYFIMANQGGNGMFVMSIGYTLISIGSMISNGVGMSYAAIGGMLLGQEDYFGMQALFRRGMTVTLISPVCFSIASIFSRSLAAMFGADTPELLDLAQRALPLICVMLFSPGIISSMVSLHTVLGHRAVSSVNTIFILLSIVLAFVVAEKLLPPDRIWMAFPFAAVISLFVFLLDTTLIVLKSKGKLQMISLIPKSEPDGKTLDISVECNMEEKNNAIDMLIDFLQKNNAGELENSVVHCLDEMMMNIVNHSGRGNGSYMDLSVMIRDGKVVSSLRNNGKPFDPLQLGEEERKVGLKIVFHYCTKLEYRYSFGQNIMLAS